MSQAAEVPANSTILASHPNLTFSSGRYSYRMTREGDSTTYTVTDGTDTISLPILWAFGRGTAEQTYILRIGDDVIESRVSFYSSIDGLDITLGATEQPGNLRAEVGRTMDPGSLAACFGCHTTGAVENQKVAFDHVRVGVRCDNCHQGALRHSEAALRGDVANASIKSLKNLSPARIGAVCGRCHRTSEEVLGMDLPAVQTIRFQPYRLALSRCYDDIDVRISCTACHNPHQPAVRNAAAYDAKCLACHQADKQLSRRPCPKATSNCTSCHMPRIELPHAHQSFADHNIRVVRQRAASNR